MTGNRAGGVPHAQKGGAAGRSRPLSQLGPSSETSDDSATASQDLVGGVVGESLVIPLPTWDSLKK